MTEENRIQAEKVRHALEGFLDRLAAAVVASLARSEQADPSTRCRSAKPLEDRTKASE
jgi:hypothetical protein